MSPDNTNAMSMIFMMLSAVGLSYGLRKMRPKRPLSTRIGAALLAGIPLLVLTSIGMAYKCLPSSTTGYRSCWYAVCGMLIAFFVPSRWIVIICAIAILITGFKLNRQYMFLVNKTGAYGYVADNGRAYNQPCPDETFGEVKVRPLWHSKFTEIYLVK